MRDERVLPISFGSREFCSDRNFVIMPFGLELSFSLSLALVDSIFSIPAKGKRAGNPGHESDQCHAEKQKRSRHGYHKEEYACIHALGVLKENDNGEYSDYRNSGESDFS